MIDPRPRLTFALALAALGAGCAEDPARIGWLLEVRAPVAGEVVVDGVSGLVDPIAPAHLSVPSPPPFTVTFIAPDTRLTVVDVAGPVVDLRAFVPGPVAIRGGLVELTVRVLDGPAEVVGVAAGQVFRAAPDGDVMRLRTVASADLMIVGLWRQDGRATHLTRRPLPDADRIADREIVLAPDRALDGSMPITVSTGPGGAVRAELTEGGLATGLLLGAGRVEPGVAVAIPRPMQADPASGVRVRLEDGGAGLAARRTVEATLGLDADGAALDWIAPPEVLPEARGPDAPAWLDVAARQWTFAGLDDASWIELRIDGRGDCVGAPWRVVMPPAEVVALPPAVGPDPLAAPLVEMSVTAVRVVGDDLAGLLADGPPPVAEPERLTVRRTATTDSVWRTGPPDCPAHPLRGLYVIDDAVCSAATVPPQAVVTRCGALAPLSDGAGLCGRFDDGGFAATGGGRMDVQADEDGVLIDAPGGPVGLHPLTAAAARPPADAVGDWSRFTLSRQPLNAAGQATAAAVVVEAGLSTAATISAGGDVRVRTGQWAFDARLIEGDADAARAAVQTAGCAARPPEVELRWLGDAIEIRGEAIDGDAGRRWILALER